MRLLVSLALLCASLLACGSVSRTERRLEGECPATLTKGLEPGASCVVADECAGFCCACQLDGNVEAQVCLNGQCATEAATCDDALRSGGLCS
jgi:hypothetical protein